MLSTNQRKFNHDGKLNLKVNIVNTSQGRHTKNKHCHYFTTKWRLRTQKWTQINNDKIRRRQFNHIAKLKLNHKINVANKDWITSNKIKTNKKCCQRTNENSIMMENRISNSISWTQINDATQKIKTVSISQPHDDYKHRNEHK